MLTLPDRRAADDYDCGSAAVDAVLAFYGLDETAAAWSNPVQGMAPDTVEAVLRASGLTVLSGTMSVADLQHLTKTRPVLCPVDLYGGHWVVVVGVARGSVYYHDSAAAGLTDPVRAVKSKQFEERWRDRTTKGQQYDRWGICAGRAE